MGITEELGELVHAQLKGDQKIRYTPEQVYAKKADAIGDVMIYASDFCSAMSISLQECVSRFDPGMNYVAPDGATVQWLSRKATAWLGKICEQYDSNYREGLIYAIGGFVCFLRAYCTMSRIDLMEAVDFTWSKVKQRDWIANPVSANLDVEGSL